MMENLFVTASIGLQKKLSGGVGGGGWYFAKVVVLKDSSSLLRSKHGKHSSKLFRQ
jgi:ribulose 1,5-bisphosphate synthetase/thiazole synthase